MLVTGGVLARTVFHQQLEATALIAWLREVGSSLIAVPLFFVMFLVATSAFAPAVALMLTAGVTWGAWPGTLYVWLAANLTTQLHFLIGRWVAGDAVRGVLQRPRFQWLARELEHGGVFATVMIRQLPLPFLLVNLAGGASPMPWGKWSVGNLLGLLPNCVIYTQLAATLVAGVEGSGRELALRVVLTAALVIGSSLVGRAVQRRLGAQP